MQNLGSRQDIGVIGLLGLIRTLVRCRIKQNHLLGVVLLTLAEDILEVVVKIRRTLLVGTHHKMLSAELLKRTRHSESLSRTDNPLAKHVFLIIKIINELLDSGIVFII